MLSLGNILNYYGSRLVSTSDAYSSPFTLLEVVCYFELFRTFNIKSKIINLFASTTLGVYMIHDNYIIRNNIYNILKINQPFYSYKMLIYIILVIIGIFIICSLIDLIRQLIFYLINKFKPFLKLKEKIILFVKSFNTDINW